MAEGDWAETVWAALAAAGRRQQTSWAQVRAAYERSGPEGRAFYEAVAEWGAACGVAADLADTVADMCRTRRT